MFARLLFVAIVAIMGLVVAGTFVAPVAEILVEISNVLATIAEKLPK